MKPPRALWVSFELGRPLGIPGDPEFQTRVLLSALKLLDLPEGPVLEDFPEDADAVEGEETVWACPVNLTTEKADYTDTERLTRALRGEFLALRPWYDQAVKNHGRTTVGVSGVEMDKLCDFVCSFLKETPPENPRQDLALAFVLNLAVDDLKAFYFEAVTAQPGESIPGSDVLSDWFWKDTIASKVLFAVKKSCENSSDGMLKMVCSMLLIPAAQAIRNT